MEVYWNNNAEFYTIVFMLVCAMDYSYAELFILTVKWLVLKTIKLDTGTNISLASCTVDNSESPDCHSINFNT